MIDLWNSSKGSKNGSHFENGGHFEFENVKFGFLDLKNPRKVLLHKIIGLGIRNLPKYSKFIF